MCISMSAGKYNSTFECHDVCVYMPVFFMPIIGV